MSTEIEKTAKPKAPRKPRKKAAKKADKAPLYQPEQHNVGIKKTRLMQLAEGYGDSGLLNPRSIHPIVYMLAEMGEGTFGAKLIDNCQDAIALSNTEFSKQKALGFLADQIIRKYLSNEFDNAGKDEVGSKLSKLPVLNDASYVDYFMAVSTLERDAFRTTLGPLSNDMVRMMTGYQTENPAHVCRAITNFFKATKNQAGFESLLKNFCLLIKSAR